MLNEKWSTCFIMNLRDNVAKWERARNYAIYQAVKQGPRGTRERVAKANGISRQRIAEIVTLTERHLKNGDYDEEGYSIIKSASQLRSHHQSQPKDLD